MKMNAELKRLNKILRKVKSYREQMGALGDEELSNLTNVFKRRLSEGETLDELLCEAFAAICEADYRILGKMPYDAQILGAIAMHQGKLVEMNTGEGKTLVATMPLYLNALTGKSTILLTTNEYLALRDAAEMGEVYRFMGLSVVAGVKERAEEHFSDDEKRAIYEADIVYTTHGVLGFDYLLNNLVKSAKERFMRELYYVIIDEADSVLLDSAQTPLVISGSPRVQSNLYELADFFVTTLSEGRDYEKEEKKVWLTKEGVAYAERFFQIPNFYGAEYFEINRHVTLALRAYVLFEPEKEYVVSKDGELQLLDNGSGRMMKGMKLRGGQHQALEVKEKLKVSMENRSVASITYQNLFQLFPKMAGMSGTISDARDEIRSVYGLDVVVIPPNCTLRRKDLPDIYYRNNEKQFEAALDKIIQTHQTGQPVLIVVSTIGETELVSKMLLEEQIPHSVLNANNAFWEAEIIKEAGQKNAVTVATSMAGRGTDIRLGEEVKELGGLAVIGIGRMMNVRLERQARGRAGRQGDPGFSQFFLSLQDEVVRNYGLIQIDKYAQTRRSISKYKLKKVIDTAQQTSEEFAVMSRNRAMEYDQVMKRQRTLIYDMRNRLLDDATVEYAKIIDIVKHNIQIFLREKKERTVQDISRYILDNLSYRLDNQLETMNVQDDECVKQYLHGIVRQRLIEQEQAVGQRDLMMEFMRIAILQAIDNAWIEEVDYLQQLQYAISGRSLAQRNLVYEYQKESLESFQKMERAILRDIVRNIMLSNVHKNREGKLNILFP